MIEPIHTHDAGYEENGSFPADNSARKGRFFHKRIGSDVALVLSGTIFLILITFGILLRPEAANSTVNKEPEQTPKTSSSENREKQASPILCETGKVTLKEYDGKIAVYSSDGSLLRTINVPVKLLPEPEQEAVYAGMVISLEDLAFAIESFES